MSHHKGALPETYVLGSQPIYEDEAIELPNGDKVKTGRKVHKLDISQALFKADGKPVGERLLRQVPAWQMGSVVGVISHWVNEAAKRRRNGDMTQAEPAELVQVPVYRGISARLANQTRAGARRERKQSIHKRIVAELAKRRQAAALAREGKAAHA